MARRLVERGVRFVQIHVKGQIWDNHSNIVTGLGKACGQTDQPVGALLTDLKERGLLETTLVLWGGEFGRLPLSQRGLGRDHGPAGFSVWMAGGGVKGGIVYGGTDDIGYKAVENRTSVHDFHATMLHWAPTHPAQVCLLNLDNGEEQEIYPLRPRSDLWRKRVAYLGEKYAEWGVRLGNQHRDPNQFDLSVFGTWYDDISDTLVLQMFFGGTERCGLKYDDGLEHVLVLYRNLTTHPHAQEAPLLEMLSRFDATTVEDLMNKLSKLPDR